MIGAETEARLARLARRAKTWLGRIRAASSRDHDTHGVVVVIAPHHPRGEAAIATTPLISDAERLAELLNVLCDFVAEMQPHLVPENARTRHE